MKIKDIIKEFSEDERKEVEATVDACMASICCEKVQWRDFIVFDASQEMLGKLLKNLSIEFLLPIAEKARDEKERSVIIFCTAGTAKKQDEIWFVKVNSTQLHATITLSTQTVKYLVKK